MKVLAIGAAGYVGGAVVDALLERGHEVRVLDLLLFEDCFLKPVWFKRLDIRNRPALAPHLDWADCVIWLAAIVGDGACALDPQMAVEINQQAVAWLSGVYEGRIIFPSTCSVYGAQDALLTESSPTGPLSIYAQTKLEAEGYLKHKNALILRLGTLFGVGDTYSRIRTDLVVNTMTIRACTDNRIQVRGGAQWRPLLYVKDAARLMAEQVAGTAAGIYNLAATNVQIADLAAMVADHFHKLEILWEAMPATDERNYRVSTTKAQNALGFKPNVFSIHNGIEELAAIVRAGRLPDPWHPRFSNERHLSAKRLMLD